MMKLNQWQHQCCLISLSVCAFLGNYSLQDDHLHCHQESVHKFPGVLSPESLVEVINQI